MSDNRGWDGHTPSGTSRRDEQNYTPALPENDQVPVKSANGETGGGKRCGGRGEGGGAAKGTGVCVCMCVVK